MRAMIAAWGLVCAMFLGVALIGCEKKTETPKPGPTTKKPTASKPAPVVTPTAPATLPAD